ncbi:hypothetical protein EW146_g5395 [Bondarzewia mesenterica]|uniref:Uncharacterized protein n=1 Tax=Bondarzewia mesenterica TaxID=1095465 RepID=A0A4V3XEV1_9AGAM|nr:hypothetical protein EW146_g5395 [Bondarzewia mesenterica]
MYNHSPHLLHPISPSEDAASGFSNMPYTTSGRDMMPSQYTYSPEQSNWQFSSVSSGSSSGHSGSPSSLLNPSSSGYPPSHPTINASYSSSISSISMQHSASLLSPDSWLAMGYSSIYSITYEEGNHHGYSHDYFRPRSGHPRPPHAHVLLASLLKGQLFDGDGLPQHPTWATAQPGGQPVSYAL